MRLDPVRPTTVVSRVFSPCCSARGTRAPPGSLRRSIRRATRLLPRQPARIVVVDREPGPVASDTPPGEAFARRGDDVVYLVRMG